MCFCEIHRFQNLSRDHRLYNGSFTYTCYTFFNPKLKLGHILVPSMTNISNMSLAQCWTQKTSSGPIYDSIEITSSKIWPFLIVDIYYFYVSLIHLLQKNEILESWHEQFNKLKETWNSTPILQTVQKFRENYCPCLYLLIGQVWWLNELMHLGNLWDRLKYNKKYCTF